MKIVLATGGSAGHLFPAIEAAKCLRTDGHEVVFLGAMGAGKTRITSEGFSLVELRATGLQGKSRWADFKSAVKLFLVSIQAITELRKINPQVVAGFGGYGAFPVVSAAVVLGIPSIIHEQNVVPGRANKLLSFFVKKVAVSFKHTKKYLTSKRLVHTGCPISRSSKRFDRLQSLAEFGFNKTDKIILVFGGSQGSQRINQIFCEFLRHLQGRFKIQVMHISGKGKLEEVKDMYDGLNLPHVLFEFFEPMEKLYQLADVVISRSGASTIGELTWFKKPAILVPYPYAQGHQKENADVLVESNTARIVQDADLTPTRLMEDISYLLEHPPAEVLFDRLIAELNINGAAKSLAGEIASAV
ncbi:MAG: undecaprenyldiphospho-muramoylpentapeptide beta-N-acetylglucosaminyltransferase [Candidatus Omnitrophota bacterium]